MAVPYEALRTLGVQVPTQADVYADPRFWKSNMHRAAAKELLRERVDAAVAGLKDEISHGTNPFATVNVDKLSPKRQEIYTKLSKREWFQGTDQLIKHQLFEELPASYDGFLTHLLNRPEEVGGVQVKKLERLVVSNFGVIPIYRVEKTDGSGQSFTYEYFSWNKGEYSGAKGIGIVQKDGKPVGVTVLVADKFAIGEKTYDAFGGFIEPDEEGRLDSQKVQEVMMKVGEREFREEYGLPDLKLEAVVNLGQLQVDGGMTNNAPSLFAAIIDANEVERLQIEKVPNLDPREFPSKVVMVPLEQLPDLIARDKDSYFQASLLRAVAEGLIPAQYLVPQNKEQAETLAQPVQINVDYMPHTVDAGRSGRRGHTPEPNRQQPASQTDDTTRDHLIAAGIFATGAAVTAGVTLAGVMLTLSSPAWMPWVLGVAGGVIAGGYAAGVMLESVDIAAKHTHKKLNEIFTKVIHAASLLG